MRRWLITAATLLALPLLAWGAALLLPGDLPGNGYGKKADLLFVADDGSALGGLAHAQRRAGPWLEPEEITPLIKAVALAAEDRRFALHPGIDPLALSRALWQNLWAGQVVSGGSTITMQLARLERPTRRTLKAKAREMARALWLEARLGKDQILSHYLNRAPFGGPLVGLAAASRELFGKTPQRLSPAEAALLMALPQDPSNLLKPAAWQKLLARRNRILNAMAMAGSLDQTALAQALSAPIKIKRMPASITPAPHFIREVAEQLPQHAPRLVRTHINPDLQSKLSALVTATCQARRQEGLRQAAVLVLRNRDRAVLAWVGSADWRDPAGGQVDGVLARRSPGSALKPFLYALALQSGRTLADLIADEPLTLPVSGGSFRPVDYDGKERGQVRLRVALASSLNLPALRLAQELTPSALLLHLRKLGFGLPKSAEHYGLGLALGDGEVSLWELTAAYSALATGGMHQTPLMWLGQSRPSQRRVMSADAARLVTDALADDRAREMGFGRHSALELPFPAAAKTGTSQQHRDNWCLGFTEEFTVGVWVGNFQGKPMAGISGLTGAGPLWRQIMLLLHHDRPGQLPPWPAGLERHGVCSLSGALPSRDGACPVLEEYFAPGTAPENTCPLHGARQMAKRAEPRPKPALTLLVPAPGAVYALDPDVPPDLQVLAFKAQASGPVKGAVWKLDGRSLAASGAPLEARMVLTPGKHTVELAAWGAWGQSQTKAYFTVCGIAAKQPFGNQTRAELPNGSPAADSHQ